MTVEGAIRYLTVEKQKCLTEFNVQKRCDAYDLAIYALQYLREHNYGCYDYKKSDKE